MYMQINYHFFSSFERKLMSLVSYMICPFSVQLGNNQYIHEEHGNWIIGDLQMKPDYRWEGHELVVWVLL